MAVIIDISVLDDEKVFTDKVDYFVIYEDIINEKLKTRIAHELIDVKSDKLYVRYNIGDEYFYSRLYVVEKKKITISKTL